MNRIKSIAIWVLRILLAAIFALQGIVKLTSSPGWVSRFKAWGYPDNFYLLVGAIELAGAVALLIPRLAVFGALTLLGVMIGATITHLVHGESQVITTLIVMALLAIIVYVRRSNISHLFGAHLALHK